MMWILSSLTLPYINLLVNVQYDRAPNNFHRSITSFIGSWCQLMSTWVAVSVQCIHIIILNNFYLYLFIYLNSVWCMTCLSSLMLFLPQTVLPHECLHIVQYSACTGEEIQDGSRGRIWGERNHISTHSMTFWNIVTNSYS